jgi:hypothetical protein
MHTVRLIWEFSPEGWSANPSRIHISIPTVLELLSLEGPTTTTAQ